MEDILSRWGEKVKIYETRLLSIGGTGVSPVEKS
jgi:hypothetical protein